jgi:endonuclease/exonuclease/phosphatase family metal-dependent hydrolase
MRIATWNLEHGGPTRAAGAAQEETLRELAADVVALTEPPPSIRAGAGIVASPPLRVGPRGNESWVAVVGPGVEPVALEIPYERMAVAARARKGALDVIVYCAVLPWLAFTKQAPDVVRMGESSLAAFARVLEEQVADVRLLQREAELVIWAGDFNQTLEGTTQGGSESRRSLLLAALDSLGYEAWNASAQHAISGMCSIDLLCGPRERTPVSQGRIDPVRDGIVMSDHAGYWVRLEP